MADIRDYTSRLRDMLEANKPTFNEVRAMLLQGLNEKGWTVVDGLKIPHATSPDGESRLWFKSWAIYQNDTGQDPRKFANTHSLSSDMREFPDVDKLIRAVEIHKQHFKFDH